MNKVIATTVEIPLRFYLRQADHGEPFDKWPVEPEYTNELQVDVYFDDESTGVPPELKGKRLQVHFSGTTRALAEMGKYLVAFSQLETRGERPHEHFEDVHNEDGEPVHLIVGRVD